MPVHKEPTAAQQRASAHARAREDARYVQQEAAARQNEILSALDDENLPRLTAVTLARVAFTVELLARVVADLAENA